MKNKSFRLLIAIVSIFTLCLCFPACNSSGDDDSYQEMMKTLNLTNFLVGKKWTLDGHSKSYYRFFRNHMVMTESVDGKLTSGMLTYNSGLFFGAWRISGDTLRTTFNYGPYQKTDNWNYYLYGTLITQGVPKSANSQSIDWKGTDGVSHYFSYEWKNRFVDYTDESDHDRALHGTWKSTKFIINKVNCTCHMTFYKDGSTRIWADEVNIDFKSTYTTKDGIVKLDAYVVPSNKNVMFLYVREKDGEINFYYPNCTDVRDVWTRE